jgi:leucyl/phenylalanyl-tRNA--protein transferase
MPRYSIPQLGPAPDSPFPDPERIEHPDGLLAWGGDLSPTRLLNAYRQGVFPWYDDESPILWWSPAPRAVLIPHAWRPPRRLRRTLRKGDFKISIDRRFGEVIDGCAAPRRDQQGTWISAEMREAFLTLHRLGHAHSVEVNDTEGRLIGGLYGVALGRIFFAESKFHRARDASKIALASMLRLLERQGFLIADCQIWNPHLETLGVRLLSRSEFGRILEAGIAPGETTSVWPRDWNTIDFRRW